MQIFMEVWLNTVAKNFNRTTKRKPRVGAPYIRFGAPYVLVFDLFAKSVCLEKIIIVKNLISCLYCSNSLNTAVYLQRWKVLKITCLYNIILNKFI